MANQQSTAARSSSKDKDQDSATVYKAGGRASALYAAPGTANVTGQADLATMYITQLTRLPRCSARPKRQTWSRSNTMAT